MQEDQTKKTKQQNKAAFTNSSDPKMDQIQKFVKDLVSNYQEVDQEKPRKALKASTSGRDIPGRDLVLYKSWLAEAHRYFNETSNQKVALTYASEWVLDNYHIIRQSLQQIDEDLTPGFYKELPILTSGPLKDFPRIYAISRAILLYQHLLLDPINLQSILIKFQEHATLTIGELWALPIFLRYGLIEFLAQALISTIHPSNPPDLPPVVPILPGIDDPLFFGENAKDEAANSDNVANIILSLRAISEQDWSDFFESVSCLERILRKDPAGVYPRMDFETRDQYRREIEELSFATGRDECELAEITINMALSHVSDDPIPSQKRMETKTLIEREAPAEQDRSAKLMDDSVLPQSTSHIGEYLFGKGRAALEHQIGYRPDKIISLKRWVIRHASVFYLSSILLLTILIFILLSLTARLPQILRGDPLSFGSFPWDIMQHITSVQIQRIAFIVLVAALLVPVLTIATSLVNWLITLLIRPRILPKLDFKHGIPDPFQTLVVIPTMITNCEEIDSLVHQLELQYLRNPEPGLHFALLTDLRDAESESLPEDEELIRYAAASIEKLNKKYKNTASNNDIEEAPDNEHETGTYQDDVNHFYILQRRRLWNPSEGRWMGWERKRGKLHELNLLLRGGTNLSFINLKDSIDAVGDALHCVRFVITLDTDTILPNGAACRLASALAHPLNRAVFDETSGQVVSGYTILQPRMEIQPKSANYSWFTRFFAGDAGLDLYTLAVSDAYQDFFGEGSYVGKGIYDVDAFERSVKNLIPENTVLSHDLLEGSMGRAGLVTDITMIEDYPLNYFIQTIRQRRWIRGDWQLLPWLFRPNKQGLALTMIDRWKIFDNLRRSMLAPALLLIFILGLNFPA